MSLTVSQLMECRAWVGPVTVISDADLQAYAGALGDDPHKVSLQVLRERRADLVAGPLEFGADGDYSEKRDSQLKALDVMIHELEALIAVAAEVDAGENAGDVTDGVGRLYRGDRERLFGENRVG